MRRTRPFLRFLPYTPMLAAALVMSSAAACIKRPVANPNVIVIITDFLPRRSFGRSPHFLLFSSLFLPSAFSYAATLFRLSLLRSQLGVLLSLGRRTRHIAHLLLRLRKRDRPLGSKRMRLIHQLRPRQKLWRWWRIGFWLGGRRRGGL